MTTTFDRQNMTTDEYNEAICTYSALMLHDDGIEITAERLTKAIKSSGNDAVPYWPSLFAKALQQNDVQKMHLHLHHPMQSLDMPYQIMELVAVGLQN